MVTSREGPVTRRHPRTPEQHRGKGRWPAQPTASAKVSLLLPYYREERPLIEAALRSATSQTHADLEVLIVNDGSPRPDAAAMLADLAAQDARVRVLQKENGGVASARNHAIAHATGDYFVCLDADNMLRGNEVSRGNQITSWQRIPKGAPYEKLLKKVCGK